MVPTLMCGGSQDPTVFYQFNTVVMAEFWAKVPTVLPPIDVSEPNPPPLSLPAAFQASQAAQFVAYTQSGLSSAAAAQMLVENYHANVAPFCALAARAFFEQF